MSLKKLATFLLRSEANWLIGSSQLSVTSMVANCKFEIDEKQIEIEYSSIFMFLCTTVLEPFDGSITFELQGTTSSRD